MKQRKLIVPIYNVKLVICIVDSHEEGQKIEPDFNEYEFGLCQAGRGVFRIILLSNASISYIAHECEHAKNGILSYIGQKADYDSDEIDAYLLQYIVEQVEKLIKNKN